MSPGKTMEAVWTRCWPFGLGRLGGAWGGGVEAAKANRRARTCGGCGAVDTQGEVSKADGNDDLWPQLLS